MKKSALIFILSICVISCISSVTSSIFGLEGYNLKSKNVCNRNLLVCPLNEKISDKEYRSKLISYLFSGKLRLLDHVLNEYYSEVNLEPVFVYCNEDYTQLKVKDNDYVDISEEMLIYRSFYYSDKEINDKFKLYGMEPVSSSEEKIIVKKIYYFYFDMDTILEFFSKSRSFLSVSDLENFFIDRGFAFTNKKIPRNIHKTDQEVYQKDVHFHESPFRGIIRLLTSMYRTLNVYLLQDFYYILQTRYNLRQMTTFDFFSYLSIRGILENKIYTILKL